MTSAITTASANQLAPQSTKETTTPRLSAVIQTRDLKTFSARRVSSEINAAALSSVQNFIRPTEVLVSRWFPGFRVMEVRGPEAEETIARFLAEALGDMTALDDFARLLSNPRMPREIIAALFPRSESPVRSRKYMVSEYVVRETIESASTLADADIRVKRAITHVFLRVLGHYGIIQLDNVEHIIGRATGYVVSREDLRTLVLIDRLQGLFSESRVKPELQNLDQEATPSIIADSLARLFRNVATLIPEIRLQMRYFETAMNAVTMLLIAPSEVPDELRCHASLITLSGIANLMVVGEAQNVVVRNIVESTIEVKTASDVVMRVLASSPSIQSVTLEAYAREFGQVPFSAPEGIRKGLGLYKLNGQSTSFQVVQIVRQSGGLIGVRNLDPVHVRPAADDEMTLLNAGARAAGRT